MERRTRYTSAKTVTANKQWKIPIAGKRSRGKLSAGLSTRGFEHMMWGVLRGQKKGYQKPSGGRGDGTYTWANETASQDGRLQRTGSRLGLDGRVRRVERSEEPESEAEKPKPKSSRTWWKGVSANSGTC